MRGGTLARRYAKALLELAVERGELEKIRKDLDAVLEAWDSSAELRQLFDNPAVGAEHRRSVLEALAGRMGLSTVLKHTLFLLSDRRRLRQLPQIGEAFESLAEQKAGRIRAEVITAAPMPEKYFAELEKALEAVTGRSVVLVRRQDESLIAGVVTRVGDKVFDGSLRNRLDELKEGLHQV